MRRGDQARGRLVAVHGIELAPGAALTFGYDGRSHDVHTAFAAVYLTW